MVETVGALCAVLIVLAFKVGHAIGRDRERRYQNGLWNADCSQDFRVDGPLESAPR